LTVLTSKNLVGESEAENPNPQPVVRERGRSGGAREVVKAAKSEAEVAKSLRLKLVGRKSGAEERRNVTKRRCQKLLRSKR
jgi:hypothetical protein